MSLQSREPDTSTSSPILQRRRPSREALLYYALVSPAILSEVVFSVAVGQSAGYGGTTLLLPLAILAASLFAAMTFRPSILIILLVSSFFLAVTVGGGATSLGAQLGLETTVILVVASTFLALAGFSYGRGLKLLDGQRPDMVSSGPLGYNLFGVALESALPIAAAVALVVLVGVVVSALGAQAARLPAPLSTLAALYLQTRIGLVFTTLFVAGAVIWTLRQFIEPLILHFTLSPADAKIELLSEIEPTVKKVAKFARYRPSGGLAWSVLTAAYCVGMLAALALFLPREEFYRDLVAAFELRAPSPTPLELLLQNSFQNGVLKVDLLFAQLEDYLREIIRLLWG